MCHRHGSLRSAILSGAAPDSQSWNGHWLDTSSGSIFHHVEIASISAEGRPWPISLEGEIGRRNVSRSLFSFRLNCRGSQETAGPDWRGPMQFDQLKRREFITFLGGAAAAWPLAARAQQGGRMRHVGVLVGLAENDPEAKARFAGFQQGFEKLGWFEGRNVRFDFRYAPAGARVQAIARELIALQPEAILAQGTPVSAALKEETRTVPGVFVGNIDPVGSGFVSSLVRPGGNLTGFLSLEASIAGKWLGMLREIAPRLTRAALVSNPKTIPYDYYLRGAEVAASSLGIELVASRVDNAATDIERVIESFARVPDGGLFLPPDTTTVVNRDLIIALAARHRLPAVYAFRPFVAAGGLMSYGTDYVDLFRQAASYVDRILRGEKPADLPVQVPTKYETVINLTTAKALGLEVPPTLLVRADEVIE